MTPLASSPVVMVVSVPVAVALHGIGGTRVLTVDGHLRGACDEHPGPGWYSGGPDEQPASASAVAATAAGEFSQCRIYGVAPPNSSASDRLVGAVFQR